MEKRGGFLMKNTKTGFRWRVEGFDVNACEKFVNKCVNEGYGLDVIEGVLNDNYLIYGVTTRWSEYGKSHKVKFDYLIFREDNSSLPLSHIMVGIKERGMTEDERRFLESFLEEYDEQEEEWEKVV